MRANHNRECKPCLRYRKMSRDFGHARCFSFTHCFPRFHHRFNTRAAYWGTPKWDVGVIFKLTDKLPNYCWARNLVCFRRAEQSYVNGRVANLVLVGAFWIGGNRIDETHGWQWSSGAPFNFFYWADGKDAIQQISGCSGARRAAHGFVPDTFVVTWLHSCDYLLCFHGLVCPTWKTVRSLLSTRKRLCLCVCAGEPNNEGGEHCAEMWTWNSKWNDVPCAAERGIACKKYADVTIPAVILPSTLRKWDVEVMQCRIQTTQKTTNIILFKSTVYTVLVFMN